MTSDSEDPSLTFYVKDSMAFTSLAKGPTFRMHIIELTKQGSSLNRKVFGVPDGVERRTSDDTAEDASLTGRVMSGVQYPSDV